MNRYYLAYGSNLDIAQMMCRCPDSEILGTAYIDDYELLFKGSQTGSYLTIEKKQGSKVPVAVYKVSEQDEKNLDRYEGCPRFYYKKDFDIEYTGIETGKTYHIKAFAYIMHEDRFIGIPSDYYINTCSIGYNDFGFDKKYLRRAINKSIERYGCVR